MTADFQIEAVGGGSYDLVLVETEHGRDVVLIGHTEETHPQATLQRLTYEFGTWLGESPFDRSAGFPWLQAVFGRQPLEGIGLLVLERAQNVEGVEDVTNTPELLLDTETGVLQFAPLEVRGATFAVTYSQEIPG